MGKEDTSRSKPFILDSDQPQVLFGEDNAPSPFEAFLHALAASFSANFIYNAALLGIAIHELQIEIEGTVDIQGSLGISDAVRPGYHKLRLIGKAKTDASDDLVNRAWCKAQKTAPILDILRNPVLVTLNLRTCKRGESCVYHCMVCGQKEETCECYA